MKKLYPICKLWLILLIMLLALNVSGQTQPQQPEKVKKSDYPDRMVRKDKTFKKTTEIPPVEIEMIRQKDTRSKAIEATCQYDNAGLASLSSSALVSYLKQTTEYDCHASVLFNYDSYYSPIIFSTTNMQAVFQEIYYLSSSYDGTFASGLYGLLAYMHVAGYHEFYQDAITLDETTKNLYAQATDALCQNSHLFDLNEEAATILEEFLINLDYPGVRHRPYTLSVVKQAMRNLTIYDTWEQAADIKWVTGYWRIFFLMFRGAQDTDYMQAISSDSEFLSLLYDVAIDAELRANDDMLFIADNGVLELSRIATDDLVKDEVCGYLANIAGMFPRLNKNWLQSVIAINDAGKCTQYNLCEDEDALRIEVEDMLFPNSYTYDDGKLIFRAKFDKEQADELYYATRQSESQFYRLGQTDEPVTGDVNSTLTAIVFEDVSAYENYAPFLYGIPTNNGGMYLEQPSEFYTWDRPDTYSLSLEVLFRHEYVHYLQGRYWVPGYWGYGDLYADGKLTWFEEGSAELCSGGTDTEGLKLRSSSAADAVYDSPNWPTVTEIVNSNYNTAGAIYYPYGNLLWYYFYKYEPHRIKPLIDIVRADDAAGYDAAMDNLRSDAALQSSFQSFLSQVADGTIESWDPSTEWVDDKYFAEGDINEIENAFTSITGNSSANVTLDASNSIRRFRITGQITGQGTAYNNSDAALSVGQALDDMMTQLKQDEWLNNFDHLVGYFENVSYSSGTPTADLRITGSLKNANMPDILFANFEADQTTSLTGVDINFTNTSLGNIKSANWNFQGGTPSTSSNRDALVNYNTAGQFDVSLTVNSPGSSDTRTKNGIINIYEKSSLSYCNPTHTTPQTREITGVTAGGINNPSGESTDGHSDYTNLLVQLVKGASNTIRVDVTAIMSTSYAANHLGIWIDYNENGTFDTDEKIVEITGTEELNDIGYYETTIDVPVGATSNVTVMRVRHAWISTGDVIDPCSSYAEGEAEDYSVVFVGESDDIAPTAPTLTASNSTNISVDLSWSGATDNVGVTEYEVLYDNIPIAITNNTTYHVTGLSAGNSYSFTVIAKDAAGNSSPESNTVVVTTGDPVGPDAPILSLGTVTQNSVALSWTATGQTYDVYMDGVLKLGNQSTTNCTVLDLNPGTTYSFTVIAKDASGNSSVESNVIQATTGDVTGPDAPVLSLGTVTENSVDLSWTTTGVSYELYNGTSLVISLSETNYTVTGLEPSTTYSFTVKALDASGNTSPPSNEVSPTTLDPPACTSYCASQGNSVTYEWISEITVGSFTNSSDAAGYSDFTGQTINLTAGTSADVTLTPGFGSTSYVEYWKIWIDLNKDCDFDDAGEELFSGNGSSAVNGSIAIPASASGITTMRITMKYNSDPTTCETFSYGEVEDYKVNISGGDLEPPSTPTGLSALNIFMTTLDLTWNASTDNVSVASYDVFEDGNFMQNVTGITASITGLNPETPYTFTVVAKDAAGNESFASDPLSTTTLADTEAPTTPTGFTSSNQTSTTVDLSWNASTDNVGVTEYEVLQDGAVVAVVTGLSTTISGLSESATYTFTVRAKDAAENTSVESSPLEVVPFGCDIICESSGNSTSYEWIAEVAIGSFSNTSDAAGYSDFTNQVINLTAGTSANVTLTPGFSGSAYSEYWKIWIDLNDDCDYDDAGEELFSDNANAAVNGSISIPSSVSGTKRMRIVMMYNGAPTSCGSYSYGETEDYTVSIAPAGVQSPLAGSFDVVLYPNPVSDQMTIQLNGAQEATIELIRLNGAVIKKTNITNSVGYMDVSEMPGGLYYVRIIANEKVVTSKVIIE